MMTGRTSPGSLSHAAAATAVSTSSTTTTTTTPNTQDPAPNTSTPNNPPGELVPDEVMVRLVLSEVEDQQYDRLVTATST